MEYVCQELYLEGEKSISLELLLGCSHSEKFKVADLANIDLAYKQGYRLTAVQAIKAQENGLPVRAVIHNGWVNSLKNVPCKEEHIFSKLISEFRRLEESSKKEITSLEESLKKEAQDFASFKEDVESSLDHARKEHDRIISYWKQRAFSAEGRIR